MEYNQYEDKRSSGFATASMVLGIVGLATGCCVYTGIICGALAMIFALLSRGGERTMSTRAKVGLGLGIAGIVCGILMFVFSLVSTILTFGSFENFMESYMDLYQQMMEGYGFPQTY